MRMVRGWEVRYVSKGSERVHLNLEVSPSRWFIFKAVIIKYSSSKPLILWAYYLHPIPSSPKPPLSTIHPSQIIIATHTNVIPCISIHAPMVPMQLSNDCISSGPSHHHVLPSNFFIIFLLPNFLIIFALSNLLSINIIKSLNRSLYSPPCCTSSGPK